MSRARAGVAVVVVVTLVVTFWLGRTTADSKQAAAPTPPPSTETTTTASIEPVAPPDETTVATPEPEPTINLQVAEAIAPSEWQARVDALPAVTIPSDCPLPLDDPISLPNSERDYRGGVHQGIDFICLERGHTARAALPGRIVQANNTYVEPNPADRNKLLSEAQALGRTPPWTLAMLYGRYVVIDHGDIPGVGHTVSVYAHLNEVDPTITPGRYVEAGTALGEVGNRGTDPAADGTNDPRSIHLHWELIVDDVYVGAGLGSSATSALYADLFAV